MQIEMFLSIAMLVVHVLIMTTSLIVSILFFRSETEKYKICKGSLLMFISLYQLISLIIYFKQ